MLDRRTALCGIATACVVSAADRASAQSVATKPIRLVVGFAPGGPTDVMARLVGQRAGAFLGQPVVVDNRPGASGAIAARAVAESDPDGTTLLLGSTSTLIIAPLVYKNVGYDPAKDFAPVALLGTTSSILIVNPALPVHSVAELIALARAQPGRLNYSSAGIGTPPHLIGEMLKQRLGLEVVHVPYKSGGQSMQAVIAGETQFSFENPAAVLPLVEAGNARALAVTSTTRSAAMPDLPTMIEAGVPDFTSVSFTAVLAPARTPPTIVGRLNAAINDSLRSPEVAATLTRLAVEAKISSPDELEAFVAGEREKWSAVVKAAGVRVE
jgi:tripartite-type tricarboxylate transporter receptor subunit TctC